MKTLGSVLDDNKGHTSGFDYMRLMLALCVVAWHTVGVSYGKDAATNTARSWIGGPAYLVMPLFFGLSGFLVTASLFRARNIWTFLALRGLRIYPALMTEVVLSALILGPCLTELPLQEYFHHTLFHIYFLNILGLVSWFLPGMFVHNPLPYIVNSSLWTVPYEMLSYLLLFLFSLIGFYRKPARMIWLFALVSVLVFAVQIVRGLLHQDLTIDDSKAPGLELMLFFFGGFVVYIWRNYLPHSIFLFLPCFIIPLIWIKTPDYSYLMPVPVAYAVTYLGLLRPKKLPFIFTGDYSYGVYLYSLPLQQTVAKLWPGTHVWYLNGLVTLPFIALFAAFSWHFIEKPTLRLKRFLYRKPVPAADGSFHDLQKPQTPDPLHGPATT